MTATKAAPPRSGHNRILELDALRGLAALAVVLYHYTWYIGTIFPDVTLPSIRFSWGCYGVQLFFAISGFLTLKTLDGLSSTGSFVRARFMRLFPAYWISMTLTFAFIRYFGPPELRVGFDEYLFNLPMLQLFTGVRFVDGVYWSLSIEIVFYGWMLAMWRLGLDRHIERTLMPWIALPWLWWAVPVLPDRWGLVFIVDHIPYFAIGIISYRIWAGQRIWYEQLPILAFAAGTAVALGPTQVRWVVPALCVTFLTLAARKLAWIVHPALTRLGDISYPLYLLHGAVGYTIILWLVDLGVPALPAALAALAGALLLAAVTTMWLEPLLVSASARRRLAPRGAAMRDGTGPRALIAVASGPNPPGFPADDGEPIGEKSAKAAARRPRLSAGWRFTGEQGVGDDRGEAGPGTPPTDTDSPPRAAP